MILRKRFGLSFPKKLQEREILFYKQNYRWCLIFNQYTFFQLPLSYFQQVNMYIFHMISLITSPGCFRLIWMDSKRHFQRILIVMENCKWNVPWSECIFRSTYVSKDLSRHCEIGGTKGPRWSVIALGAICLVHWRIRKAPECLRSHNARYIMIKSDYDTVSHYQGPVLLTFLRHVARISANGIAAFKDVFLSATSTTLASCRYSHWHPPYVTITHSMRGSRGDPLTFIGGKSQHDMTLWIQTQKKILTLTYITNLNTGCEYVKICICTKATILFQTIIWYC